MRIIRFAQRLLLLSLISGSVISLVHAQEEPTAINRFVEQSCPFNNISPYRIQCGSVTMPLDHDDPENGQNITIAVAIIHSLSTNPEPDPVIYLEGGPGGENVAIAPLMPVRVPFLQMVLQSRDVILVDQRGMGLSRPSLTCLPYESQLEIFDTEFTATYLERMPECLNRFAEEGINWTKFTTRQNALDLSNIGAALGYEEVNLFGISYGTLLGLIILRDNPVGIRSVILDSVLPPSAETFSQSPRNMSDAFDRIVADCEANFVCRLAYPNLRETFITGHERIIASAETIHVNGYDVSIAGFSEQVGLMMAKESEISRIPMFISAVGQGDYSVLQSHIEQVLETAVTDLPDQALYMTMVCPEGIGDTTEESMYAAQSSYGTPFQVAEFNMDSFARCGVWGDVLPFDRSMPESNLPILLLSGEYDPLTPARWAEEAAVGLSSSVLVEVPYTTHVTLNKACPRQIAMSFLNSPGTSPDTSCLATMSPPNFTLHISSTRPFVQVLTGGLSLLVAVSVSVLAIQSRQYTQWLAWRFAFRRLGAFPLIACAVIILVIVADVGVLPGESEQLTVVQYLIPLLMAIQAAMIFAPADESALEIQLALPRPPTFILLERVIALFLSYALVAGIGLVLTMWLRSPVDIPSLVLGWIPPALFLSSIGIYVTMRSRVVAFGVVLSGFLWFIFGMIGPLLIPGTNLGNSFLNLAQSFLWPLHVHASLEDFSAQDFWLNRLFLTVVGIGIFLLAVREISDPEQVLLNPGKKRQSKSQAQQTESHPETHRKDTVLNPAPVDVSVLMQVFGMAWYEMKMIWRGRALKVLTIVPLVGIGLFGFVYTLSGETLPGLNAVIPANDYEVGVLRGEMFALASTIFLFVQGFYLLPMIMADRIPSDHTLHTHEILRAAPLTNASYLSGKVLGAVFAGILSLFAAIFVSMIYWRFMIGSYVVVPFVDVIAVLVPGMIIYISIAVLIGSTQTSTHRAILIVLIGLTLFQWLLEPYGLLSGSRLLTIYVEQIMNNVLIPPLDVRTPFVLHQEFTRYLIGLGSQVILFSAFGWAWQRYQSRH